MVLKEPLSVYNEMDVSECTHTHTYTTHTKLISLKMFHSKDTTLLNMFKNKSWPGAFHNNNKNNAKS